MAESGFQTGGLNGRLFVFGAWIRRNTRITLRSIPLGYPIRCPAARSGIALQAGLQANRDAACSHAVNTWAYCLQQ
jgi:hypothetical protein